MDCEESGSVKVTDESDQKIGEVKIRFNGMEKQAGTDYWFYEYAIRVGENSVKQINRETFA